MYIYFGDKFHECILKLNDFTLKTNSDDLVNFVVVLNMNCQVYSYLENLGLKLLDLNYDIDHDDYTSCSESEDEITDEDITETKMNFTWNPYFYLNLDFKIHLTLIF